MKGKPRSRSASLDDTTMTPSGLPRGASDASTLTIDSPREPSPSSGSTTPTLDRYSSLSPISIGRERALTSLGELVSTPQKPSPPKKLDLFGDGSEPADKNPEGAIAAKTIEIRNAAIVMAALSAEPVEKKQKTGRTAVADIRYSTPQDKESEPGVKSSTKSWKFKDYLNTWDYITTNISNLFFSKKIDQPKLIVPKSDAEAVADSVKTALMDAIPEKNRYKVLRKRIIDQVGTAVEAKITELLELTQYQSKEQRKTMLDIVRKELCSEEFLESTKEFIREKSKDNIFSDATNTKGKMYKDKKTGAECAVESTSDTGDYAKEYRLEILPSFVDKIEQAELQVRNAYDILKNGHINRGANDDKIIKDVKEEMRFREEFLHDILVETRIKAETQRLDDTKYDRIQKIMSTITKRVIKEVSKL